MKNGRYCMLIIKAFIESMSSTIDLDGFCEGITRGIQDIYRLHDLSIEDLGQHPEQRLTASAIIYSRYQNEIWMVGDCQCIANGIPYTNDKPYESRIAQQRVNYIAEGKSDDEARSLIVPDLIKAMKEGQNKEYAVIDGFTIFKEGIKVIKDIKDEVILASDGYPFLRSTLNESEDLLQNHLKEDPRNILSFKATKGLIKGNLSFDDRSYIRFSI